jgi:hypothetical protein
MTYVRESNNQGDRRHLPEKLQDKPKAQTRPKSTEIMAFGSQGKISVSKLGRYPQARLALHIDCDNIAYGAGLGDS